MGLQKLMTHKITFDYDPASSHNVLHCLTSLAVRGLEELKFVEKKLKECSHFELKQNLKKIDADGFDFLLYFVSQFT